MADAPVADKYGGGKQAAPGDDFLKQYENSLQKLLSGQGQQQAGPGKIPEGALIYLGTKKGYPTKPPVFGPFAPGGTPSGGYGPNYGMVPPSGTTGFPLVPGAQAVDVEDSLTYQQARGLPLQWMSTNPDMLRRLVNGGILRKLPGFEPGMGLPEIMSAWDDLLKASYGMNQSDPTGKKWSPWDVMETYSNSANKFGTVRKGDWEYDIATGERIRYVGPRSKTQKDMKVDLSSEEDVRVLTTQVLTQALGRAPSAAELAQYRVTVNQAERATPIFTTQTQTIGDQGEVVATDTTTEGGLSSQAKGLMVEDEAKKGPEYGKYQSATTYWDAMMQMIGGG